MEGSGFIGTERVHIFHFSADTTTVRNILAISLSHSRYLVFTAESSLFVVMVKKGISFIFFSFSLKKSICSTSADEFWRKIATSDELIIGSHKNENFFSPLKEKIRRGTLNTFIFIKSALPPFTSRVFSAWKNLEAFVIKETADDSSINANSTLSVFP